MFKVEKDLMELSFSGSKDSHLDGVNFFSPRSSPGIWKSSDLTFTCNICDMKFSHHPALLSHKAHDHGLSAILKAVSGEQLTGTCIKYCQKVQEVYCRSYKNML